MERIKREAEARQRELQQVNAEMTPTFVHVETARTIVVLALVLNAPLKQFSQQERDAMATRTREFEMRQQQEAERNRQLAEQMQRQQQEAERKQMAEQMQRQQEACSTTRYTRLLGC